MARGSDQANAASTAAVGQNQSLFGGGQSLYGTLAPQLTAQAANPQGVGPEGLARLDTAAQQSAGGSQAAATGEAALEDSRTRNAMLKSDTDPHTPKCSRAEVLKGAINNRPTTLSI